MHREEPARQLVDTADVAAGKVCKQGAKSDATFGVVSADRFVLLNHNEHGARPSLDWVVATSADDPEISRGGDSGAWVYDANGCLVGVVVGRAVGVTMRRTHPSSGVLEPERVVAEQSWHWITPIRPIFRDIERVTGCKVTLERHQDDV